MNRSHGLEHSGLRIGDQTLSSATATPVIPSNESAGLHWTSMPRRLLETVKSIPESQNIELQFAKKAKGVQYLCVDEDEDESEDFVRKPLTKVPESHATLGTVVAAQLRTTPDMPDNAVLFF